MHFHHLIHIIKTALLNLAKEEFVSLKSLLSKNANLSIQKSDKGNSIVIINKDDYLKKMRNILSDSRKFSEICIAKEKYLNFLNQHREANYRSPKTVK